MVGGVTGRARAALGVICTLNTFKTIGVFGVHLAAAMGVSRATQAGIARTLILGAAGDTGLVVTDLPTRALGVFLADARALHTGLSPCTIGVLCACHTRVLVPILYALLRAFARLAGVAARLFGGTRFTNACGVAKASATAVWLVAVALAICTAQRIAPRCLKQQLGIEDLKPLKRKRCRVGIEIRICGICHAVRGVAPVFVGVGPGCSRLQHTVRHFQSSIPGKLDVNHFNWVQTCLVKTYGIGDTPTIAGFGRITDEIGLAVFSKTLRGCTGPPWLTGLAKEIVSGGASQPGAGFCSGSTKVTFFGARFTAVARDTEDHALVFVLVINRQRKPIICIRAKHNGFAHPFGFYVEVPTDAGGGVSDLVVGFGLGVGALQLSRAVDGIAVGNG